MDIDVIIGLSVVIIFMVGIMVFGCIISWYKQRHKKQKDLMLANRELGIIVSIFTMTATWVGGGYVNGIAEAAYSYGLLWVQAIISYPMSLVIGGYLFAKRMRDSKYTTMIDPFQIAYGKKLGALVLLPAICGEIFWCSAILAVLGHTLHTISGISLLFCIIGSASLVVIYTFFGGLFAVAYTDVLQLLCILFGLVLAIPFMINHPAVNNRLSSNNTTASFEIYWGKIEPKDIGRYVDQFLLLILGGIPWQSYFQRILAIKNFSRIIPLSFAAAVFCTTMGIPSLTIGMVARNVDWQMIYGNRTEIEILPTDILSITLKTLTPKAVGWCGLGAITAAVMSSADSAILSSASMFSYNVWNIIIRKNCSTRELTIVTRISTFVAAIIATILAYLVQSIYSLWILAADVVYISIFPQLIIVIYFKYTHKISYVISLCMGILLRTLAGIEVFALKPIIKFPFFDEEKQQQLFPFTTIIMLFVIMAYVCISFIIYSNRQKRDKSVVLEKVNMLEPQTQKDTSY
ncbi:hypothetical protein SNEBB_008982 [Seison nebaliae]|nr:hypothetical protein SNEBB_008982 [Seison nebaliae]